MKSDYFGHDDLYKARKAAGYSGWADDKTLSSNLDRLDSELKGNRHSPATGRVLELGCGAGNLSIQLAAKGFEVHGVDISPTAIEWAKENAKTQDVEVAFRVGNVVDLKEYPDNHFDFVLDGFCLHCIIGDDRMTLLRSARRVMKRDAVFHLLTMCGDLTNPRINLSQQFRDSYDSSTRCLVSKDGTSNRYIGCAENILEEIREAGFRLLDWRVIPSSGELDHMDLLSAWAITS